MEKVFEYFGRIGVAPNAVKVILHLNEAMEATYREIEEKQGLRQPEASVAIAYLRGLGVLEERVEGVNSHRGRPVTYCCLKSGVEEILIIKHNEIQNDYSRKVEAIEGLEEFFKN